MCGACITGIFEINPPKSTGPFTPGMSRAGVDAPLNRPWECTRRRCLVWQSLKSTTGWGNTWRCLGSSCQVFSTLSYVLSPIRHTPTGEWWGYIVTWAICLLLDNKSQHGVTYFSKCSDEIPKVFLVYIDIFLTNPWPRYQKKKVFYRFHTLPGDQKSMTFFMTFKDLSPNL